MSEPLFHPPFGEADLSNCERELIHLAGSIQPHGVLLVLREDDLRVLQASANSGALLGISTEELLKVCLGTLGGDAAAQILSLSQSYQSGEPKLIRCNTDFRGRRRAFEGLVHRCADGSIVVELEPVPPATGDANSQLALKSQLLSAVQHLGEALNVASLAEAVVQCFRAITGYDRVMVYKFDPDGHGEIIAEAREPHLDSLLGHHYPASDIPQRARELYVRNRVRVLVDVNYEPAPIHPRLHPHNGTELDMSLCSLRSMSPLHIQYLKNMGVTATLVVSLVREGRLWGLIACHHYSPRRVPYSVRAASDLLAEVISTRIAAIEDYTHAQVAILVRRLEQRVLEATSVEGDWRYALFRNPRTLLQPLNATGAALAFDGEMLTAGEVPSTHELRSLVDWIAKHANNTLFSCSSLAKENPELKSLTPTASGVLAIELSRSRSEYLMWFRKEQLCTVTWAGDPSKAVLSDNPLELSPRRSFAAWRELVRDTATPWSKADTALAWAIGAALIDIVLQIQAVRLLMTQHQLKLAQTKVSDSTTPVLIADADGHVLFSNEAFSKLFCTTQFELRDLGDLAARFTDVVQAATVFGLLNKHRRSWRGELVLAYADGHPKPLGVRADVVPWQGAILGAILIFTDLTESKRADAARIHLERSLSQAGYENSVAPLDSRQLREPDELVNAILANASMAALDIADNSGASPVAPLLEELEASAERATRLYRQLQVYLHSD